MTLLSVPLQVMAAWLGFSTVISPWCRQVEFKDVLLSSSKHREDCTKRLFCSFSFFFERVLPPDHFGWLGDDSPGLFPKDIILGIEVIWRT